MYDNDENLKKIYDLAYQNHKKNNLDIAEKFYNQVLKENPNHFSSIFYLASLSAQKKNLNKSKELFEKAIQIQPNFAPAHNNLGGILIQLGDYHGALMTYQKAITIDSNLINAKNNLAVLLRSNHFRRNIHVEGKSANLKELFLLLFRRNDINHGEIFRNAKLILFSEKKYAALNKIINLSSPLLEKSIIQSLLKEELFLLMLQKSLLADLFLEKILTKLRSEILFILIDSKKNILNENLKFIISLSEQCFFNEYIFFQTKKEINYINTLTQKIEKSQKISETEVAILGCYIPLYSFKNIKKKLSNYKSDNILFNDLITMQIKEPMKEKELKNLIKPLSKISDNVSKKVRDQYEENPYPRWRYTYDKLPSHFLNRLGNQIKPNKIKIQNKFDNPSVLVAGCGTGHHTCIAKDYSNSNVLGIDLSLSSLAYAKRKTDELGFDNIKYLNADILELNKLNRKFDIIECVGVLHHMKEPLKGLEILLDLLAPYGVLKLGLYSEKARRHIVEVREFIKKNKFRNIIEDIRACREAIINEKKIKILKKIINRSDFYSTSSARDLMFHVQEHCFTLPQISKIISDFNLEFLGFTDEAIKNRYSKLFPDDRKNILLENWDNFEKSEPDTFISMYNFWIRKKIH